MYVRVFKRLFDLILSIVFIPFFLVLCIIVGIAIKLDDGGPILYCGKRLGKNGKVFKMYKFRSMIVNAPDIRNEDGSTYNSDDDPRLTKVGRILRKTSIDEIPQVLNVLKGDMSFIGPRPDLPDYKNYYEGNEIRKLEVKPGITGYNQAYFRNAIPWKERITNDIYYVDNLSLWLDLKIFFRTILSVFKRENIFIEQNKNGDRVNV